jgi:hypothetical protein
MTKPTRLARATAVALAASKPASPERPAPTSAGSWPCAGATRRGSSGSSRATASVEMARGVGSATAETRVSRHRRATALGLVGLVGLVAWLAVAALAPWLPSEPGGKAAAPERARGTVAVSGLSPAARASARMRSPGSSSTTGDARAGLGVAWGPEQAATRRHALPGSSARGTDEARWGRLGAQQPSGPRTPWVASNGGPE